MPKSPRRRTLQDTGRDVSFSLAKLRALEGPPREPRAKEGCLLEGQPSTRKKRNRGGDGDVGLRGLLKAQM